MSQMGHSRRFGCRPALPVYPDEQTFSLSEGRSQTGQIRTHAAQPNATCEANSNSVDCKTTEAAPQTLQGSRIGNENVPDVQSLFGGTAPQNRLLL
jgi:hypothetical protein